MFGGQSLSLGQITQIPHHCLYLTLNRRGGVPVNLRVVSLVLKERVCLLEVLRLVHDDESLTLVGDFDHDVGGLF